MSEGEMKAVYPIESKGSCAELFVLLALNGRCTVLYKHQSVSRPITCLSRHVSMLIIYPACISFNLFIVV